MTDDLGWSPPSTAEVAALLERIERLEIGIHTIRRMVSVGGIAEADRVCASLLNCKSSDRSKENGNA